MKTFYVSLILSILLLVGGFLSPPLGIIDSSVLSAVGLLFAFATLAQLPQLLAAIAQGRTFRLTKGDLTGMSLILYCGHFFMLFRYAMNDIGDDAPYHEAVGLVDTDGRVGLVPGNEPAEGSAFVDLELLDGKLAIYEGYDEVAVGWFYLAVDDGKVAVKDAGSCHAVA